MALPTFRVIVSLAQSEEYPLTHTTPQGLGRRVCPLPGLLPGSDSSAMIIGSLYPTFPVMSYWHFLHQSLNPLWEQDPWHLCVLKKDIFGCVSTDGILCEVHNLISLTTLPTSSG